MARILLLAHEFAPFRGGIATAVEGLAAGAAGLGHDTHVLAPDYYADNHDTDSQRNYAVHRFPGDFCSILSFDKLSAFALRSRAAIRRIRPDIVHAADPQAQMAITALARFGLARHFFFTVHGTELIRYREERMPRLWMRGAFRRPIAIAAVSHAVRRMLDTFATGSAHVFVSHPAIAPLWFEHPPANRGATRRKWNAGPDDLVLITVARRVPDKGHRTVIEAAALLEPEHRSRIRYVVVGEGPADYATTLTAAAREAGIALHLAGSLDDDATVNAIDSADLFVMPSHRTRRRLEGFGLAYIEAAARGVPSIAVNTGGAAEAVLDGETGIVLPEATTPGLLADALRELLLDPARRTRLGLGARRHAASRTRAQHASEVYDAFLAAHLHALS